MKIIKHLIALIAAICILPIYAQARLPRATATSQGVSPNAVISLIDSLQALPDTEIHHLMIVRNGYVVAEGHSQPFTANDVHTLFSCSKTITSLAVGIAIDENRLRLSDRVATFFPDQLPDSVTAELASLTIRHLLTMDAGGKMTTDLKKMGDNWEHAFLNTPDLGTDHRFRYNSFCTYMLSAIIQRVTGQKLADYLQSRLFEPLGITDFDSEESPTGICNGGWGMRLGIESMAKIGQMLLQGGVYNDRRIVSEEWTNEMGNVQIEWHPGKEPSDINQGYGYQMWRCLEPGVIRADGAYGQYIIIDKSRNLVVALTGLSVNGNSYKELRCVWKELIPGINAATIKYDNRQQQQLTKRLASMSLPMLKGKKVGKNFRPIKLNLTDNELGIRSLSLGRIDNGNLQLTITMNDGIVSIIPLAFNNWASGEGNTVPYSDGYSVFLRSSFPGLKALPFKTAGNYAMTDNHTLTAHVKFTTWISNLTLRFTGIGTDTVSVEIKNGFQTDKSVAPETTD